MASDIFLSQSRNGIRKILKRFPGFDNILDQKFMRRKSLLLPLIYFLGLVVMTAIHPALGAVFLFAFPIFLLIAFRKHRKYWEEKGWIRPKEAETIKINTAIERESEDDKKGFWTRPQFSWKRVAIVASIFVLGLAFVGVSRDIKNQPAQQPKQQEFPQKEQKPQSAPQAEQTAKQKKVKEEMDVKIGEFKAENKYDPYSVYMLIENNNSFNWEDCDLELNGAFKKHMDTISTDSQENKVSLISFVKKGGEFFDIRKYAYQSFEVKCSKPYFDIVKYQVK